MYSEIDVKVEDGSLGRSSSTATHAQVKIGVSDMKSDVPLLVTSSMEPDAIKEKLGLTPPADACMDAIENGLKTIYALPVPADAEGSIGEVAFTGTGSGTLSVSGKPNNAYDVVVQIIEGGKLNAGSFCYSTDGGNSYSDEITLPLAGKFELPGTGLVFTFSAGGEDSETQFMENDVYTFDTTAPTMSNASVLKAVEKLFYFNTDVEVVHIVGTSGRTLWAALQSEAEAFMEKYRKPVIFLCEGRPCGKDEKIDEYLDAMQKEQKGITSRYLCICLSYASYLRADLRTQNINLAGVVSGLIGKAKESLSVGCVEEFPVSCAKILKLLPAGIEEYSKELDALRYTVFRQYTGKDDFYVANANVMAAPGSDYPYVENVRVLNRIVKSVNLLATDKIQAEIDPNHVEVGIKKLEAHLNIAIDECVNDGVISSGEVTINTENVNILVDETLGVKAAWVPMGSVRKFNITFAVRNPAAV